MLRNLADAWDWIRRIIRRMDRIESGAMLENSSITNGRMRFIGGLLRLDSGARLEGVGTFQWSGPGSIAGNWEVLQGGVIKVGGVLISPVGGGRIMIGEGPVGIILDGGAGSMTTGNVRIEGGKIYVGTGSNLIVIDGATGKVTVGSMVLDPSNHNGMITMPNDAQVLGFENNLELYGPNGASGRNGVVISPDWINIAKIPTKPNLEGLFWLGTDVTGKVWKVSQNTGGPIGGPLQWPFPASTVTSEYGPREAPGEGASTFHEGMDFAPPEGTPIPAAGGGTVELAGLNGGFGNCVIINHGGGLKTLYGHMQSAPSVTVGQQVIAGQIIGAVGNTGVSFGAHLHFEVHVNGTPVNPRTKLPIS